MRAALGTWAAICAFAVGGCGTPTSGVPVEEVAPAGRTIALMPPTPGAREAYDLAVRAVDGAVATYGLENLVSGLAIRAARGDMYRFLTLGTGPLIGMSAKAPDVHARVWEPAAALILLGILRMTSRGPELALPPWLESHILKAALATSAAKARRGYVGMPPGAVKAYLEGVDMDPGLEDAFRNLEELKSDPKIGSLTPLPADFRVSDALARDVAKAAHLAITLSRE